MALHELEELRDRVRVFRDRAHAGEVLAGMLEGSGAARILAVPAGGLPVAAAMAAGLGLEMEAAVVSKITPSWNSEVGYGAVAFDGSVRLNDELVRGLRVSDAEIRTGIEATSRKVRRRVELLGARTSFPELAGRTALLVDDGLASGFTMQTAVEALGRAGASSVIVAVPTGSLRAAQGMEPLVAELYCANVRGGWSFAVADAYESWSDVGDEEALAALGSAARPSR